MSDEIVRRLRSRCQESLMMIKDSLPTDGETEEEEEELGDEELDTEESDTSEEDVDPDEQDSAPEQGPLPSSGGSSNPSVSVPDDMPEEDMPPEDDGLDIENDRDKDHVNPLDNQYAVKFGLGERVALAYSDGTATDAEAVIEGYDGEGFYRIKLAGGMTINGLTDIALTSLVKGTNESVCVCGHTHFVYESSKTICDRCGRPLRENSNLTVLSQDKKKKNIIRSEQHPVSTANKPNISENIKKAFSRKPIKENDEESAYSFAHLRKSLEGEFWTKLPELVADIEDLGYDVLDSNAEYVIVSSRDENEEEMQIPLGGTSRTLTLDFRRARIV